MLWLRGVNCSDCAFIAASLTCVTVVCHLARCQMTGSGSPDEPTTKRDVMPSRLERYERAYRALAAELAGIGFISQGSVVVRYTTCGKAGCRCQEDPPRRHGPYYQWSRAVAGKTVNRRLSERETELYRGWIANRRRLEEVVARIGMVTAEIIEQALHCVAESMAAS